MSLDCSASSTLGAITEIGLGTMTSWWVGLIILVFFSAPASTNLPSYYAHPTVLDANGVIAPWYQGLNGQLDERLNIAVNVYKRYPWVDKPKAVMAAPDFIYNSHWSIKPDGTILIPPTTDWMCGDLCQRAWSIVKGLTAYYQYSGDPIAFIYIPLVVDYILDYGLTDEKADWPLFPISTPTRGKAYGKCDPTGRNQLDLCAITGIEVLRAHKLTGNPRYLQMAKHWGDVFAAKCQFADPTISPWNRYVDPSVVGWSDELTGTTAIIVDFLDDLLQLGYRGKAGAILKARDGGRRFLNEQMLPAWWVNDTWARTYWDWDDPMMCGMVSMCADHIMRYPRAYPNWRNDLRNMLSLLWNRNGADPASCGDVYSGAWAFPESSVCCRTSLSYNQYTAGPTLIRYGVLAGSDWAVEIGRRMMIMATYDSLPNGVVMDGLFGDQVATGEWSNLAHPWPLCQVMEAIAWLPAAFAPNRENHIVRSTTVVTDVHYEPGRITYTTFPASSSSAFSSSSSPSEEVLRLSFIPTSIRADGRALKQRAGRGPSRALITFSLRLPLSTPMATLSLPLPMGMPSLPSGTTVAPISNSKARTRSSSSMILPFTSLVPGNRKPPPARYCTQPTPPAPPCSSPSQATRSVCWALWVRKAVGRMPSSTASKNPPWWNVGTLPCAHGNPSSSKKGCLPDPMS